MIVHSMDPPGLFPYKRPQMEKVFGAVQRMLRNAAKRASTASCITDNQAGASGLNFKATPLMQ